MDTLWQPIETAPKAGYIIITDGLCLPDVVVWHPGRAAYTDHSGNYHHTKPEGWFNVSRSRITAPRWWIPLPAMPLKEPPT